MQTRFYGTPTPSDSCSGTLNILQQDIFLNAGQQLTLGNLVLIPLLINWQINVTQSGVLIRLSVRTGPSPVSALVGPSSDKNSGGRKPRPRPAEPAEPAGEETGIKSGGGASYKERADARTRADIQQNTREQREPWDWWHDVRRHDISVAKWCQHR